jgi:hypothetical protein
MQQPSILSFFSCREDLGSTLHVYSKGIADGISGMINVENTCSGLPSLPHIQIHLLLSEGQAFAQQKSRITFSGNPAIFFKTRGFPNPSHDGFGFSELILDRT